jgi:hypothetical protein
MDSRCLDRHRATSAAGFNVLAISMHRPNSVTHLAISGGTVR